MKHLLEVEVNIILNFSNTLKLYFNHMHAITFD